VQWIFQERPHCPAVDCPSNPFGPASSTSSSTLESPSLHTGVLFSGCLRRMPFSCWDDRPRYATTCDTRFRCPRHAISVGGADNALPPLRPARLLPRTSHLRFAVLGTILNLVQPGMGALSRAARLDPSSSMETRARSRLPNYRPGQPAGSLAPEALPA